MISTDVIEFLASLYAEQRWPLDKLPYTDEFDDMLEKFCDHSEQVISARDFWRLLVRLRKDGHFPNKTARDTARQRKRTTKGRKQQFGGFWDD